MGGFFAWCISFRPSLEEQILYQKINVIFSSLKYIKPFDVVFSPKNTISQNFKWLEIDLADTKHIF